jgi:hypothetical protein
MRHTGMTLLLEDSRYLGVRSQKQGSYDERRNFEALPAGLQPIACAAWLPCR